MLSSSEGQTSSGVSTWGFVIFLLILFWFFGGNGFGFGGHNAYGYGGAPFGGIDPMADCQRHSHQNERDVLSVNTRLSEQTAGIQQTLQAMQFQNEQQTARILEGQKDLYIRDLERIATQQFVTGQTSAIERRLDAMQAAGALQRQADQAAVTAQLTAIQNGMLKAPAFVPYGGLPTIGCANYTCGCGTGNGCCNS